MTNMQIAIRIENATLWDGGPQAADGTLLVAIREEMMFLASGETATDVVLGAVAQLHPFASDATRIVRALREIEEKGISCPMAFVMPGALVVARQPEEFAGAALPTILVDIRAREITPPGAAPISMDAFCGTPRDRWGPAGNRYNSRMGLHPFAYRHATGDAEVDPICLEGGSIATGMLDGAMGDAYGGVSEELMGLLGPLLGLRGDLFTSGREALAKEGYSIMTQMHERLHAEGHVCSDRAWMPRTTLPGPGFAERVGASRGDLLELGRALSVLRGTCPELANDAARELCGRIDLDPFQLGLRDRIGDDPSNHRRLEIEALLRTAADLCGVDPSAIAPRGAA